MPDATTTQTGNKTLLQRRCKRFSWGTNLAKRGDFQQADFFRR